MPHDSGIPLRLIDQGRLLSPTLAGHIRERAQKLGHFFDGVEMCRVRVEGPGHHSRHGRVRVRVCLRVAGLQIAINRRTGEDLPMAIRESFDAADQRLEDFARRSRRNTKRAKRSPGKGPSSNR